MSRLLLRSLLGLFCLASTAVTPPVTIAVDDGVVAGWDRLDGRVLLGELNCTACHASGSLAGLLPKQAPILAEVGGRVTPQFLRAFLADPLATKPGTTMPDLLHGLAPGERKQAVEALTHYLASLGGPIDQRTSGASRLQLQKGQELYHTVGCVACHAPAAPPPKHKIDPSAPPVDDDVPQQPGRPSVPHGPLAMKTTVDELAKFLADPLHVRPAGRMPSLGLRHGEASLIAAYLLRDQYDESQAGIGVGAHWSFYNATFNRVAEFDKLKPAHEGDSDVLELSAVQPGGKPIQGTFGIKFAGLLQIDRPGKYKFSLTSDDGSWLKIGDRVVVDHDGAHSPSEKSGEAELPSGRLPLELRMFNSGGGFELSVKWQPPDAKDWQPLPPGVVLRNAAAMIPSGATPFVLDRQLAAEGQKLFGSLGCASCHTTDRRQPPAPPLKVPALSAIRPAKADQPNAAKGCLSETVAAGRPKYGWSAAQREAVRTALAGLSTESSAAADQLNHRLTTFQCYACHARQGKGGPDADRFGYFTYEVVVDLGDEGRTPPVLNETGAKLTPLAYEDTLFRGKRYRTYMATRMPLFGEAHVGPLPALFATADAGKLAAHVPSDGKKLIDDGRTLVGKKGVTCINCHAWAGLRLPGAEGLDLLESPRRLRPEWFHAWLVDPQPLKPRTRMPTIFPNGKSFFPKLQDGDMHRQIDALWAYLAAGEKGGIPTGLSASDGSLLVPIDEPIVFRTFLDGVSAHAILVGFRQRTHVAFDANRVRTAVAWSGNFVSTAAAWDGRAGQYAKIPSTSLVRLPDGPPFAVLDSLDAAWPADVAKASLGESRAPPGWRFRGYRYDAERHPTFLYGIGVAEVEESPRSDFRADASILVRSLRLTAAQAPANLYFRVAAAAKIDDAGGTYVTDGKVRYRVKSDASPSVRVAGNGQELLVPVSFRSGPGGFVAQLEIEMTW